MTTGIGMYFQDDILNILTGHALTVEVMPEGDFRDGFMAALAVVAASFGLQPFQQHVGQNRFYVERKHISRGRDSKWQT